MAERNHESFLQPIISFLGLVVSIVSSILPLFSGGPIQQFFIRQDMTVVVSFTSLVFGLLMTWIIFEYYKYPLNVNFGKMIDRGKGYPEPKISISRQSFVLHLFVTDIVLAFLFFYLKTPAFGDLQSFWGIVQAFTYIVFFIILMTIFSYLITSTWNRVKTEEDKENLPWTIFSTLERYRLIKPGVEIYEDKVLYSQELAQLGMDSQGIGRKILLKTIPQKEEVLEVVVSYEGKNVLKVLKKEATRLSR